MRNICYHLVKLLLLPFFSYDFGANCTVLFFTICLLLINNLSFLHQTLFLKNILLIAFTAKAISAVFYGYLFKTGLLLGNDSYMYFQEGNLVFSTLKEHPLMF